MQQAEGGSSEDGNGLANEYTLGDSITFSCQDGYILSGTATVTCGVDGTFGVVDAVCTPGKNTRGLRRLRRYFLIESSAVFGL